MRSIEATGKSVDAAIFAGLQQLGISIDEVNIEILQTESKGILGIGAKAAKVRLTEKPAEEIVLPDFEAERRERRDSRRNEGSRDRRSDSFRENRTRMSEQPVKEKTESVRPERRRPEKKKIYRNIDEMIAAQGGDTEPETLEEDNSVGEATFLNGHAPAVSLDKTDKTDDFAAQARPLSDIVRNAERVADEEEANSYPKNERRKSMRREEPEAKPERSIMQPECEVNYSEEDAKDNPAAEFVTGLLAAMNIDGKVLAAKEEGVIRLRIDSGSMGILIGHRGETLDAIQYLTSLVINRNRKEDGYTRITINTEDYREKREETLVKLAKRVAQQVKNTGRARVLEPMNPYERRILHSTLQNNPYVATHSEGEEPNRRVVVTPKRRNRSYNSRRPENKRRYDSRNAETREAAAAAVADAE